MKVWGFRVLDAFLWQNGRKFRLQSNCGIQRRHYKGQLMRDGERCPSDEIVVHQQSAFSSTLPSSPWKLPPGGWRASPPAPMSSDIGLVERLNMRDMPRDIVRQSQGGETGSTLMIIEGAAENTKQANILLQQFFTRLACKKNFGFNVVRWSATILCASKLLGLQR